MDEIIFTPWKKCVTKLVWINSMVCMLLSSVPLPILQGEGHVNGQCSRGSSWTVDGSLPDVEATHYDHLRSSYYGLLLWYVQGYQLHIEKLQWIFERNK